MWVLPSYTGREECSAHPSTEQEPCWGEVRVAGDIPDGEGGFMWIHMCEGHIGQPDGDPYAPSNRDEDRNHGPTQKS